MALGKKPQAQKEQNPEKKFVTLAKVLQSPRDEKGEQRVYIKANNYKGRLIWQEFGGEARDDEENSTYYEILSANIKAPYEGSPEFVLQEISLNLANPKAAKKLA